MEISSSLPRQTIFVQLASYRDPQLIPTMIDLIERAERPECLRIVVCWQRHPAETVVPFLQHGFSNWRVRTGDSYAVHSFERRGARVELIDVPHMDSKGTCWARNMIQQRYGDERYTLQIDSHHRFVDAWDALLIDMLEKLRSPASPKPLLTAYLPYFNPLNDPDARVQKVFVMRFSRFIPEGAILFDIFPMQDWDSRESPPPARFYSGHFAFADGIFSREVQHDPHFFFNGEEISIAARAFTHGYDLYHPHRLVAWHEYTRQGRARVWDDHGHEAKSAGTIALDWADRDALSHRRNRALFGMEGEDSSGIDLGNYGFGTVRTLAEYESYAGVSFAHRGVHQATQDGEPPDSGTPVGGPEWLATLKRSNELRICIHHGELTGLADAASGRLNAYAEDGTCLYTRLLDKDNLHANLHGDWFDVHLVFLSRLGEAAVRYSVELLDDEEATLMRIERAVKN